MTVFIVVFVCYEVCFVKQVKLPATKVILQSRGANKVCDSVAVEVAKTSPVKIHTPHAFFLGEFIYRGTIWQKCPRVELYRYWPHAWVALPRSSPRGTPSLGCFAGGISQMLWYSPAKATLLPFYALPPSPRPRPQCLATVISVTGPLLATSVLVF